VTLKAVISRRGRVAQTIPEGCLGAVAQEALSPWPLKFEPLISCGMATQTTRNELLATRVAQRQEATFPRLRRPGCKQPGPPCEMTVLTRNTVDFKQIPNRTFEELDDRFAVTAAIWPLRDGKWGSWNVLSTDAGVLPGTTRKAARAAGQAQGCIDRDQHLLCLRHPDNLKQIIWATLPGFPATMFRLLKAP
jgi:hypothetical protein